MNPFRDGIVADPWRTQPGDVPSIHQAVFEQCLNGLDYVRHNQASAGLLIHGEAGSGKTHLLSRLRAYLTPQAPIATDRPESLFVWVRLQTSPRMIWRTLRRTLVNDWFRPIVGTQSQFDRILSHRLAEIRVAEGDLEPWIEFMREEHPEDLSKLIDEISTSLDLERNTAVAFEHLAFNRHRRDLRAWLSGDSLPESALEKLNLVPEDGADEVREEEAQRVVLMLCRLAGNRLPIVIGLDQVEALQLTPRDPEGLFAFGKLTSTLHDNVHNVLAISCVQSAFATELKDRARAADYDRVASLGALSLDPLNTAQAEAVLDRRLTTFPADLPDEARANSTWPLSADEFDNLFHQERPVTPRRLLGICAERYDALAMGIPFTPIERAAPSPAEQLAQIGEFLSETYHSVLAQKQETNTPDQTEEIIRHGLPLLNLLLAPDQRLVRDELLQDVSLVFEYGLARVGVALCIQQNMRSLTACLKRLITQHAARRVQRLVIIRDSRVPITAGSKAARENLEKLEQSGVILFDATPQTLAAIDTLRDLMSDARSGDLACNGETISPATLEDWLRSHLSEEVKEFHKAVLGQA